MIGYLARVGEVGALDLGDARGQQRVAELAQDRLRPVAGTCSGLRGPAKPLCQAIAKREQCGFVERAE